MTPSQMFQQMIYKLTCSTLDMAFYSHATGITASGQIVDVALALEA